MLSKTKIPKNEQTNLFNWCKYSWKKKDSRKYAAGYAYLQAISEVNNSDFQEWTKKKMKKMNKIKENCKRCAQTWKLCYWLQCNETDKIPSTQKKNRVGKM